MAVLVVIFPGLCNLLSSASGGSRHADSAAVVSSDNAIASQPALEAPQSEPGALFSVAGLELHNPSGGLVYWQPLTWSSPRIIPEGLVLSYLCDSARHQCSGVQLI